MIAKNYRIENLEISYTIFCFPTFVSWIFVKKFHELYERCMFFFRQSELRSKVVNVMNYSRENGIYRDDAELNLQQQQR